MYGWLPRLMPSALALMLTFVAVQAFAQRAEEVTPITVQILKPADEQQFRLSEPNVTIEFKVTARAELREVVVETVGEHTGIFFSVCGAEAEPCKGEPPSYSFRVSSPVFEGANIVKVRVIDKHNNVAEASIRVHVTLPDVSLKESRPEREQYKLLIITHGAPDTEDFKSALQPLVQHKNSTGMPTRLLTLEEIYETPEYRGRDHPETIKKAILDAKRRWGIQYVMLVGDSDRFPVLTREYTISGIGATALRPRISTTPIC